VCGLKETILIGSEDGSGMDEEDDQLYYAFLRNYIYFIIMIFPKPIFRDGTTFYNCKNECLATGFFIK
jgi:hypothetical protein